jgi:hypothetical protein
MADQDDGSYVRAPTLDDVARVCRSLNANQARYLLIGGFALILHGGGRTTRDIDLLVDPSPENVARLKRALAVLPDNAAAEIADTDIAEYSVVRVADEVMVDLIARACGVSYETAAEDAETVEVAGVAVPVVSKRTLVRTKETIRPQDHLDRAMLAELLADES